MNEKTWSVEWTIDSRKQLLKLDRTIQKRILSFLYTRVIEVNNPRMHGKLLKGDLGGFCSYRIGDYRVLANIQDEQVLILIVQVEHRRSVYDK